MVVKTAQTELNAALKPIFWDIPNIYQIYDDLIIATENIEEHLEAICEVIEVILPLTQTNVLLTQRK